MDIIKRCQNCGKKLLCDKLKSNDGYCEDYAKIPRDSDIEIKEGKRIFKCKYCGTTLERDKNEELQIQAQETFLKFFKYTFAYMGIMQVVALVFFLVIFLFIIGIAIFGFTHV